MKSRFSHRQIHLLSNPTFAEYLGRIRTRLGLPDHFPDSRFAADWNASVEVKGGPHLGVEHLDLDVRSLTVPPACVRCSDSV